MLVMTSVTTQMAVTTAAALGVDIDYRLIMSLVKVI